MGRSRKPLSFRTTEGSNPSASAESMTVKHKQKLFIRTDPFQRKTKRRLRAMFTLLVVVFALIAIFSVYIIKALYDLKLKYNSQQIDYQREMQQ